MQRTCRLSLCVHKSRKNVSINYQYMSSNPHKSSSRKQQKKDAKKAHKNTAAVFRVRPSGTMAQIKYKGFVTEGERLGDEIVELDKPLHPEADVVGQHAIPIDSIEAYDMLGRIYRSNIIGSYIVLNSNYPLMYLTVEYNRSLVIGSLLQIYLSVEMSADEKKEINQTRKYEKYRNLTFSGNWNLTMECDPELKELWREKMEPLITEDAIQAFDAECKVDAGKQNMVDDDILKWIDDYKADKMKWYEDLIENKTDYKFRTIKRARDYFIELASDPRFYELLKVAMECRVINRRREQNIGDDVYEVPDKVISMADIREQMMEDDELIISYSDSDSSSDDAQTVGTDDMIDVGTVKLNRT